MRFDINFQKRERFETFLEYAKMIFFRRETMLILVLLIFLATFSLFVAILPQKSLPPIKQNTRFKHEMEEMGLKRESVARALKVLKQLQEERVVWSDRLWALNKNVTSGLWLTGIETKVVKNKKGSKHRSPQKDALIFQGLTKNQKNAASDSVNIFIENLANDPFFRENYDPPFLVGISKTKSFGEELNKMEVCLTRKELSARE